MSTIGKYCRLCLSEDKWNLAIPIFEGKQLKESLSDLINNFTGISVHINDGLPNVMCLKCLGILTLFMNFQEEVKKNDRFLKGVQNSFSVSNPNLVSGFSSKTVTNVQVNLNQTSSSNETRSEPRQHSKKRERYTPNSKSGCLEIEEKQMDVDNQLKSGDENSVPVETKLGSGLDKHSPKSNDVEIVDKELINKSVEGSVLNIENATKSVESQDKDALKSTIDLKKHLNCDLRCENAVKAGKSKKTVSNDVKLADKVECGSPPLHSCDYCNRPFNQIAEKDEHISIHKTAPSTFFECKYCGQAYSKENEVAHHINVFHPFLKDDIFEQQGAALVERLRANKSETSKKNNSKTKDPIYKIELQGDENSVPVETKLGSGLDKHSPKSNDVEIVDKELLNKSVEGSVLNTENATKSVECQDKDALKSTIDLKKHLNCDLRCENAVKAGKSKKTVSNDVKLADKVECGSPPLHSCDYCNRPFNQIAEKDEHISIHKTAPSTFFECKYCGQAYSKENEVAHHINAFHPFLKDDIFEQQGAALVERLRANKSETSKKNNSKTKDPIYKIELQGDENSVPVETKLGSGLDKHSPKSNDVEIVDKELLNKSVEGSVLNTENATKSVECQDKDALKSTIDLKKHLNCDLRCENAVKAGKSKKTVSNDVKLADKVECGSPPLHSCDYCNRPFNQIAEKDEHISIHKTAPSTFFECKYCGQAYSKENEVAHHINAFHPFLNDDIFEQQGAALVERLRATKSETSKKNNSKTKDSIYKIELQGDENSVPVETKLGSGLDKHSPKSNDVEIVDKELLNKSVEGSVLNIENATKSVESQDKDALKSTIDLKKHLNGDLRCENAVKAGKSKKTVSNDVKLADKVECGSPPLHSCDYCNRPFNQIAEKDEHISIHKTAPSTFFECKYCGQAYSKENEVAHHINAFHPFLNDDIFEQQGAALVERLRATKSETSKKNNSKTKDSIYKIELQRNIPLSTKKRPAHKLDANISASKNSQAIDTNSNDGVNLVETVVEVHAQMAKDNDINVKAGIDNPEQINKDLTGTNENITKTNSVRDNKTESVKDNLNIKELEFIKKSCTVTIEPLNLEAISKALETAKTPERRPSSSDEKRCSARYVCNICFVQFKAMKEVLHHKKEVHSEDTP